MATYQPLLHLLPIQELGAIAEETAEQLFRVAQWSAKRAEGGSASESVKSVGLGSGAGAEAHSGWVAFSCSALNGVR